MSKLSHPHFFSFIHAKKIISKFRKNAKIGGGFILDLEEYENNKQNSRRRNE